MLGLGLNIAKSIVGEQGLPIPETPVVWYNEKSLSSYNIGEEVDIYYDKSGGTSFDLVAAESTKKPVVDVREGKKTLYFTNDSIISSDASALDGSSAFTMIYVGGSLSDYHTGIYVGDDDNPDNSSSFRLGRSTYNVLRAILGDAAGGLYNTTIPFGQNGYNDIAYAYGTSSDSSSIYVGLDNGASNQEVQFGVSGLDLVFGKGIGIGTNNPDNPTLTGTGIGWFMYEVIIYNRALSPTELTSVREYLRNKWNV